MTRREAIEAALAAWRDAERRLADDVGGKEAGLTREVVRHRTEFQRLSAAHMVERLPLTAGPQIPNSTRHNANYGRIPAPHSGLTTSAPDTSRFMTE